MPKDWLADADEIIHLAESENNPQLAMWGLTLRYDVLTEAGRPGAARNTLDSLKQLAAKTDAPVVQLQVESLRAGQALREGRFADAERHIHRAQAIWPQTAMVTHQLATLGREQLRLNEVTEQIQDRYRRFPNSPQWRTFWILHELETGNSGNGRTQFEALAKGSFASLPHGVLWLRGMAWLAEAAVSLADRERAGMIYAHLLPYAGRNIFLRNSDHTGGSVAYYLGILATTMGNWEAAEMHFRQALDMNSQAENRPFTAWTQYMWADMLSRRGRGVDQTRSAELSRVALRDAEAMGMERLASQARAFQSLLGDRHVPMINELSSREIEVLQLLINGKTNREIGEALFISSRTVGSHVSNILGKLDVRTRTEATARAIRDHLV